MKFISLPPSRNGIPAARNNSIPYMTVIECSAPTGDEHSRMLLYRKNMPMFYALLSATLGRQDWKKTIIWFIWFAKWNTPRIITLGHLGTFFAIFCGRPIAPTTQMPSQVKAIFLPPTLYQYLQELTRRLRVCKSAILRHSCILMHVCMCMFIDCNVDIKKNQTYKILSENAFIETL